MKLRELYRKALDRTPLTADEAWRLYDEAPLFELAATADRLRRETVPDPQVVTWQIDRNVNVTNVCISGCRFCNFHHLVKRLNIFFRKYGSVIEHKISVIRCHRISV